MLKNTILTKKAISVINKKLLGKKLSQQDSNYLSRFVRPKLRDIMSFDAKALLKKLEYNPKSFSIEGKIKRIVIENIQGVDSIILCGSAIQSNYKEYNDIDVIVATKKVLDLKYKRELKEKIIEEGERQGLKLDVQIYSRKSVLSQSRYNPSLIYQLKDSKIIYGKLNIPSKVEITNLDFRMKLDWSEGLDAYSEGREVFYAIRNALLVLLLMNKTIDNNKLRENLVNILGADLAAKLKNNQASKQEKKLALNYLYLLTNYLESELKKKQWEKIVIENH